MLQPIQTTGTSAQPLLSNQRSQSAKPALGTLPNPRTIQSAVQQRSPVTGVSSFGGPSSGTQRIQSGYTRIQSGVTRAGQTRIQSAAKSTKSIVKDMFHIDPPEIVFEDIKPGIVYEQVLSVQNLAKHPVRIRVQQPKTSKFRVDYDMQQGIAAGLVLKVLVQFKESERELAALNQHQKPPSSFKDVIIIESDEFKVEVHVAAYRACPKLKFDEFLDFGFVQQGTENTRTLNIQNIGYADAKVQIKCDLLNLRAAPSLINISPNESQAVNIIYKANEMGNFRQTMDIVSENGIQKLDVAACSVDYSRFLMDSKGSQITQIDFGDLYMGKSKTIKFKYVNNAPKGHQFKILTRRGIINPSEDVVNLQTPNELGIEQSEKLLTVQPSTGFVQAYASVEIAFTCFVQIAQKEQQLAKKICFGVDAEQCAAREVKYSVIVQQPDEDLLLYMNVRAMIPLIRLSKQSLQFGDCDVNDNKDILFTINNLQQQPVEIQFQKVSCFFFKPEQLTINGLGQVTVQVTFAPKNVGKYNQNIDMILNDYLHIPVKVNGEALKIVKKRPQTRGPEARVEDFQVDPKFIDTQQLEYVKKRNNELIEQNHQAGNIIEGYFEDTKKPIGSNTQVNNFLSDQRTNRLEKQRQQIIQQRVETITKAQEKQKDEGSKPPKDYEFELGLQVDNMDNDIEIPYRKDGLFVVKPFNQYEPLRRQEDELVEFKPDPKQPVKRILSARPQSHKQVRDINRELTPEDLKRIQAGPIKIDYGTIYINTPMSRTFFIHNNLRYAIVARLCIDKKEELKKTFTDRQVIDSGQEGQFEIVMQAQSLGQLKQTLRYLLNEKHSFEIMITANVETVKIEASKTTIKLQFQEDGGMSVSDSIKLTNNGVGPAQFNILQNESSKFTLDCLSGVIQGQSHQILQITYTPSKIMKDPLDPESDIVFKNQNPTRQDEEKIVLKVKDGSEVNIKCIGLVSDVKCTTKSVVEFQEVCVGQEKSLQFQVKNTSRNNAIYKILAEYLPTGCTVTPASGKIAPEENKEFTVKLLSDSPKSITTNILLMLRSGRVLRIPLTASCIVPNVLITQQVFDFGDVTVLGNQTALPLTLINKSNVDVQLIFDLRSEDLNPNAHEGVGGLTIKQQQQYLKNYTEEEQNETDDEGQASSRFKICQNKKYLLQLTPQQSVQFQLHFYPKELKKYTFPLPIEIHKYGPVDSLKRMVQVQGCSPKFIVEPKQVEFQRKIILSPPEKNKPSIQEILLSNPEYRGIQFKIQIDADSNIPSVFQVIPLAGRVDAGQTLRLKVMFNPRYEGTYTKQAQIYLEDSKPGQPYLIVTLNGVAAKPSIQYDRRELILCPVPLNIESRLQFKIFNDGFENQKLTVKAVEGFSVEFLDGCSVGLTKQHLDLVVKYTSPNPISISQTLELIDETQHSYSISVSGTSDNCTFTTWMYDNSYEINLFKSVPQLQEVSATDESEESKLQSQHQSQFTQQISERQIEQKCEHMQRWYNQFVGQLDKFPDSIILMNGHHIFELITFLTGKQQFPYKAALAGIKQKSQIAQLLYQQYKEMLLQLKVDGGLLNQIRPCYLLGYDDYILYLKTVDMKFTHPNFQKCTTQQFTALSQFSYLVLFTQILRIYYLPRVNLKAMRQINGSINEYAQSNVYSSQEMLILRWIEIQATTYWKDAKAVRITNYSMLKDAHILSALILSYLGTGGLKYFQPLGQITKQEQDCSRNMSIFLKALQDIGVESHLVLEDCVNMSNPETLLMLMLLYTQVPNFMPRKDPLLFKCVLGSVVMKTVTLLNTTKEPIVYFVKLEGSTDFSIEEDQIKIEPGGKYSYNIKFTSRISDEQSALLTFCNKKGNKNIAAAIVYELKGIISERISQKIWTVSSVMYEMKEFSITVQNTFTNAEFGHFTIQIVPLKVPLAIETIKKKKKAMSMAEKKKESDAEIKEKQRLDRLLSMEPPTAFFCKQESIRLKKGASYNLPMQFLPSQLHLQKCTVIFQDPQVGEFQYEIHGNVDPPEVIYDLKPDMQVYIDQLASFSHHIPFVNPLLRNALKQVDQLSVDKKKLLNRQSSNSVTLQTKPHIVLDDVQFAVQLEESTSYINCEKTFSLLNYQQLLLNQSKHSEDEEDPQTQMQKSDEKQNVITFNMNFKTAVKDYLSHFMLINETKTDVRRIRIQVTSLPKPIKALLEFVIPSREIVSQEIPIVNNTDRDFNLKITLIGDDRFQLVGEGQSKKRKNQQDTKQKDQSQKRDTPQHQQSLVREQLIKKKLNNQPTNGAVVIQFAPDWICDVEGTLTIYNPLTNDLYEYALKGKAEEPLSEGHYTIKTIARQPITQIIPVSNNTDEEARYSVETDVMNAAGEQEITIPPQSVYEYKLNINPLISGQFTGSVTFTGNGHYRWWTITLDTDTPKALGTVDLVSPIRKAIAFDIEIANPLPENITYEVIVQGEALSGDPWFSVLPGGSSIYQLVFQPLQEGRWKGSIAFLHPKMGEIWYNLNLIGEDRGGIRVPQFKTELGKLDKCEMLLENPTCNAITAEIEISNPTNFSLEFEGGQQLVLEPYTLKPVYIVFVPSALTAHSGEIHIRTKEIGKWIFLCFGTGETPTAFPETTVVCKAGQSVTQQIEFKNPLKDQLTVQLELEQQQEVFSLLLKKNRISIAPQSSLQIPYQFMAVDIAAYQAKLILTMNAQVKWTYPLIGLIENEETKNVHIIQTKCRIPLIKKLSVLLDGLKSPEKVMFKITDMEHLKKHLKINLPDHNVRDATQPLEFDVKFLPYKPFKMDTELQIKLQSGGLWRFKLHINALEPQIDDVIVITSEINQLSKVSFRLTNRIEEIATFKAYFTPDSNSEFTVEPLSGPLEPFGKKGTEFKVGFKPKEYGIRKEAKLIIETESMYWSYILRGHLPKYIPPANVKGHGVNSEVVKMPAHNHDKNFLIANMKKPNKK